MTILPPLSPATAQVTKSSDKFTHLNDDAGLTIFGMLSPKELAAAAQACKSWSKFLENDPLLWKTFASRLKIRLPVEPSTKAFEGTLRSCFWRGVCEAEWSRTAQIKKGVYGVETLRGHTKDVYVLQVGLDGKVYTGSLDNTAKVWSKNAEGVWICEATLKGHTHKVSTLQVGLDGKVYTGSYDGTVKVWNKNAEGVWICEATLQGHTCLILVLQVGVDGKVYTGFMDGTAQVWSKNAAGVWICEATLEGQHTCRVNVLQVGLDGKVYTGSSDNTAKVWSKNAKGIWSCEATLEGHKDCVSSLQLGLDGKV